MVHIRDLIDYNVEVRHRYFSLLTQLSWEEVVKNREASWHSMRNIFIHTLGAVNHWLNLLQDEKYHLDKNFENYTSPEDLQRLMVKTEERMCKYLSSLDQDGLQQKYTVRNDSGETIEVTAEDILIHVFEEEVHHRGEIIALLWQIKVEPPLMGWKCL